MGGTVSEPSHSLPLTRIEDKSDGTEVVPPKARALVCRSPPDRAASPRRPVLRCDRWFRATNSDGPLGDRTLPRRSRADKFSDGLRNVTRAGLAHSSDPKFLAQVAETAG